MASKLFLIASVLAPTVLAQAGAWGKCGGMDWNGATTCISGYTCVFSNPWYSQCLPGVASSSSSATPRPSSSSSTTTSSKSATTTTPTFTTTSSLITSVSTTSTTTSSLTTSVSTTSTTTSSLTTSVSTTSRTTSSTTSSSTAIATQSALLFATHFSGTVSTLTFSQSGSLYGLTSSVQTTCGTQPSWLTYDASAKILYCLDEYWSAGSLSAYNVNSAGGLSQTSKITTAASGVHSTLYGGANDNSFIAVAHYGASQISTFTLPMTSASKPLQSFKYSMSGRGPVPSRQEAPHPHQALLDPTGAFLLIPDLGADLIRIYSIARSTGLITSCANITSAPGSGPRHGSFFVPTSGSTAGTVLYIGNELSNTISSFAVAYTSSCLSLTPIRTAIPYPSSIPPATTPNGVKVAEVRVRGNTLLTSNRADNSFGSNLDSLATFDLNPSTGAFVFRNITSSFGSYPRTFSINKAGTFVAIGNQNSGTVAIVKRDPATGTLGDLAARISVGSTGTDGNGGMSSVIWME